MGYFSLVFLWVVLSLLSQFEGYDSVKMDNNIQNEDLDEISDNQVTESRESDSLHGGENKERLRRETGLHTITDILTQEYTPEPCSYSERDKCNCKDGKNGRDGRDGNDGRDGRNGRDGKDAGDVNMINNIGSVYVRWGHSRCTSTSQLVYSGIAGGRLFDENGSGANYLCLPKDPEYDEYKPGVDVNRGYVHSAEYQIYDDFYTSSNLKYNHDIPCAVCRSTGRSSILMIPAKMTCPSDWMKEYNGYLMAERAHPTHYSTEFVCVDRNLEVISGSVADLNGALFYPIESRCTTNLPCGPYIDGAELACVVCSQ